MSILDRFRGRSDDEYYDEDVYYDEYEEDEDEEDKDDEEVDPDGYIAEGGRTVMRGMFGDSDKRTRASAGILIATLVCVFGLMFAFIGGAVGYSNYRYVVRTNTTPTGTEMVFNESGAEVELRSVWTDAERDVVIAQLNYSQSAYDRLSASGLNYEVGMLVESPEDGPDGMTMRYGLLGTEGDAYLIITGEFEPKAYQIIVRNMANLSGTTTTSTTSGMDIASQNNNDLAQLLSEYQTDDLNTETGIISNQDVESTRIDIPDYINFRINPYSPATNVYEGSFTNEDGTIDYNEVVHVTSIERVQNDFKARINNSRRSITEQNLLIDEYTTRLQENPNNTTAMQGLEDATTSIRNEKANIAQYIIELEALDDVVYSKQDFGIMQEQGLWYPAR